MTTQPPSTISLVRVTAIRDYLLSHGWVERPSDWPNGLYFEHSTLKTDTGEPLPLTIPASESLRDYTYHVERIIRTLSRDEDRSEADIFHDLTH